MNSAFRLAFALVALVHVTVAANNQLVGQNIEWQTSIEQASKTAGEQEKVVLLHFTADWCRPCKTLETFVFSNARVQKAFEDNVVAVKVDVDKFPNLAREYGVSGVPFDVAITPQGRVVSKRSSPRDSNSYARMVERLSKTINELQNGSPALTQKLNELKDVMSTDNKIAEHKSFVPTTSSLSAPKPSTKSMELKRKSRVANPFAIAALKAEKFAPKVMQNDFVVNRSPMNQAVNPYQVANTSSLTDTAPAVSHTAVASQTPTVSPTASLAIENRAFQIAKSDDLQVTQQPLDQQPFTQKSFNQQLPNQPVQQQATLLEMNAPQAVEPASAAFPATGERKIQASGRINDNRAASANSYQASLAQPVVPGRVEISRPNNLNKLDATANQTDRNQAQLTPKMVEQLFESADKKKINRSFRAVANAKLLIPKFNKPEPSEQLLADNILSQSQEFKASKPNPKKTQAHIASHTTVKIGSRDLPKNVALKGKCPISLLTKGAWVDGNPKWGCLHRERVYLFASQSNLRKFQSDPDAFSPLLAGYDPVVFKRSGDLVDGAEEHGVFMGQSPNQRVVLFNSAETRAEFQANPRGYIETIRKAMRSTEPNPSKLLRR